MCGRGMGKACITWLYVFRSLDILADLVRICVLEILLFTSKGHIFHLVKTVTFQIKISIDSLILELRNSTKRSEYFISFLFISLIIVRFSSKCISLISIHFQLIICITFISEAYL